jgi:limonene-1,2-epoxide hydrolase
VPTELGATVEKATVERFLRGLENFDFAAVREVCTDDATVWHNTDNEVKPMAENIAHMEAVAGEGDIGGVEYVIKRQVQEGDHVMQQHQLRWAFGGIEHEVEVAVYFGFTDGKISCIEEYAATLPDGGDGAGEG